ncbi:phosphotransferase system HPr (HPr) family [Oceanospirillum multiglobuliferum]|uniref:HPr domain-containing protein n=1 Tax=Oceanospirillum multiglobuliferum TaxID=64969 RepID=A0A1T4KUC5_9GAMM|nr:HPr family phosphocarrier protein [Oceanospirillum multiglobuliferum]OPX54950.1 hypothetical protein BTE48_11450 [Oceanospirillum multiglobuliferum]SJZ46044.1 phosphotransferase system HPr (HPr) family [Oceanospirillum multiglobuliferum]
MLDFTVMVTNSKGFHLRPASQLLQLVSKLEATVTLRHPASGRKADCRNMMALMLMSSPKDTEFVIEVMAECEAHELAAKAQIIKLFDNGFNEHS